MLLALLLAVPRVPPSGPVPGLLPGPQPSPQPLPAPAARDVDWTAVWDELAAAESSPEDAEARARLDERWRSFASRRDDPRVRLLGARRARLGGHAQARLELDVARSDPWPLGVRESWLAIPVLGPGREHARAVLTALEGTPSPSPEQVRLAWQAAVDEAAALRLRNGALPIQRALHARFPEPWAAVGLALTLHRLGETEEADALLAATIERERAAGRPTGELWSSRGLLALGRGEVALGRDHLGRGLAQGSTDAALMLAKLDLDAGRVSAARDALRALVLEPEPSAWALRAWGLSLLEPLEPRGPDPTDHAPAPASAPNESD